LRITRDPIQLRRGEPVLVAQAALVRCALFIIELVEAFKGLAADQAGDKPWLGAGERGQDSDTRVQRRHQPFVHLGLLFLLVVHHFHQIPIQPGHDAHLGQLPPLGEQVSIWMANPDGTSFPVFLNARFPNACWS
jgi:hypothetical protein